MGRHLSALSTAEISGSEITAHCLRPLGTRKNYMKNSSHLLKRNANKRAGKKATLQQHQMEIGSICLFICKYYLPLYVSPSPSWHIHTRTYIHMYANIWQLLCAVFVAYAIARGVQWRLFVYRQIKRKRILKKYSCIFWKFSI